MKRWSERPHPGRLWNRLALSVTFIALAGIGATKPAYAASGFGQQPASGIVAQARASMASAGSVSASGTGTMSIPGIGKVTISETDYSGQTSGSQLLKVTSAHATAVALPSASTLEVGGDLYTDANLSFWTSAGLARPQAALLAGRWVHIPPGSSLYASVAADLTMPSLLGDLFDARIYHKGAVHQVDGVRALKISYDNTGGDAGPATCFIAVGGRHLPVSVTLGSLTLRLRSWGRTQTLSAPASFVPLPTLVPSSQAVGAIAA